MKRFALYPAELRPLVVSHWDTQSGAGGIRTHDHEVLNHVVPSAFVTCFLFSILKAKCGDKDRRNVSAPLLYHKWSRRDSNPH
jgi:hypothetical protein